MRFRSLLVIAGAAAVAAALWFARPAREVELPRVDIPAGKSSTPAMCPWRSPDSDMNAFFPSSNGKPAAYRTDTLALSRIRLQILRRLGPGSRLDDNSFYAHRVSRAGKPLGTVVVRRAAGPHGAIEVVVGVKPDGKVAGVRIQRHREPDDVAAYITSSAWLTAFEGKTAQSALVVGDDLPRPPAAALTAAGTVTAAVRSLLIELDEADKLYGASSTEHH